MRPVNLIPPEERRGDRSRASHRARSPTPSSAVLARRPAVLVGVITIGNQISDREAELAALQVREEAARARAEALAPYAQFATMSTARARDGDQPCRGAASTGSACCASWRS